MTNISRKRFRRALHCPDFVKPIVIALIVCFATPASLYAAPTAQQESFAQKQGLIEQFRMVRDEGIAEIGWITGNSRGNPAWKQVSKYTAPGGKYYKFLMFLRPAGADQKNEWQHNLKIYNEAYKKGRSQKYNKQENVERAKTLAPIFTRITKIHRKIRALDKALSSPSSK